LTFVIKIKGGQNIGEKLSLQMKAGFVQKLFIWGILGDFLEKFYRKNNLQKKPGLRETKSFLSGQRYHLTVLSSCILLKAKKIQIAMKRYWMPIYQTYPNYSLVSISSNKTMLLHTKHWREKATSITSLLKY
jgi:hypothetical protein